MVTMPKYLKENLAFFMANAKKSGQNRRKAGTIQDNYSISAE